MFPSPYLIDRSYFPSKTAGNSETMFAYRFRTSYRIVKLPFSIE